MYFTNDKRRAFELLMQQKPGFDRFQSGCLGSDEIWQFSEWSEIRDIPL